MHARIRSRTFHITHARITPGIAVNQGKAEETRSGEQRHPPWPVPNSLAIARTRLPTLGDNRALFFSASVISSAAMLCSIASFIHSVSAFSAPLSHVFGKCRMQCAPYATLS